MKRNRRNKNEKVQNRISRVMKCIFGMAVFVFAMSVGPADFVGTIGLADVCAEEYYDTKNKITWIYSVQSDDTIKIEGSKLGTGLKDVEVPAEIDGKPVTYIDSEAFFEEDEDDFYGDSYSVLKSVVIPASVRRIREGVFYRCQYLESIRVEDGNAVYEDGNANAIIEKTSKKLIAGCKETKIPDDVTSIGNYAFYGCITSISMRDITIPERVERIGSAAFHDCGGLKSIEIPDRVTHIGSSAFSGCYNLKSIKISKSVADIGENAFFGCGTNLESITVDKGNTWYEDGNANALIETETCTLILGCSKTVIPNNITTIGEDAFVNCHNLTEIKIPNSVTYIGMNAFSCTGLKDVYYNGTKEQWAKIDKEGNSGLVYVTKHCTDGDIKFAYSDPNPAPKPDPSTSSQTGSDSQQSEDSKPVANTKPVKATDGSLATTTEKKTATLTSAAPSGKRSVTVPSTVKIGNVAYDVTEIGSKAFKNLKKATTVTLPKTVTKIKANAFSNSKVNTVKFTVSKGNKLMIDKNAFKKSKVKKVQITVSRKATDKEIKALKKALKKAGIKEENIKVLKKLK